MIEHPAKAVVCVRQLSGIWDLGEPAYSEKEKTFFRRDECELGAEKLIGFVTEDWKIMIQRRSL